MLLVLDMFRQQAQLLWCLDLTAWCVLRPALTISMCAMWLLTSRKPKAAQMLNRLLVFGPPALRTSHFSGHVAVLACQQTHPLKLLEINDEPHPRTSDVGDFPFCVTTDS